MQHFPKQMPPGGATVAYNIPRIHDACDNFLAAIPDRAAAILDRVGGRPDGDAVSRGAWPRLETALTSVDDAVSLTHTTSATRKRPLESHPRREILSHRTQT